MARCNHGVSALPEAQPDMPESAIASGCIDFVLSPEDIAIEIVRIAHATQDIPVDVLASTSPVVAAATKEKDS